APTRRQIAPRRPVTGPLHVTINADVTRAKYRGYLRPLLFRAQAHRNDIVVSKEDSLRRTFALFATMVLFAGTSSTQVTPAAGFTPPDDTQSLRVGITVFADETFTLNPKSADADAQAISIANGGSCAVFPYTGCIQNYTPHAFNVARTYLNVTGNLSHIVSYPLTPHLDP